MRELGYHRVDSSEEALSVAHEHGDDALFLAGGQSLVNMMKQRLLPEDQTVIDIRQVDELSYIRDSEGTIDIGAVTTHADIVDSDLLSDRLPVLPEMVEQVGDPQVRNMGTIGGDLAQADPRADYPVVATALEAEITIEGTDGRRTVPASEFFTGYFETVLEPTELLVEVSWPVQDSETASGFSKFAEREGDFPLVNAAVRLSVDGERCTESRVRVGCVSGEPVPAEETEAYLEERSLTAIDPEEAGRRARDEIEPDPDEQVSTEYKKDLAGTMVENAVEDSISRLQS